MTEHPELEAVLTPLRSSFHARRRDVVAQCEAIAQVVNSYLKAVDNAILRDLASSHGLSAPAPTLAPERFALDLLSKVQNLPELRRLAQKPTSASAAVTPSVEGTPDTRERPTPPRSVPPAAAKTNELTPAAPATPATPANHWPLLRQALAEHPLVIVGGPPHLERLATLAVDTRDQVEWVDTTRQGTHAIGNLERRIKDKRISALLILEGLVQHRHSDPLVSTARSTKIPSAYGGKGGRTALAQALDELERMLQQRR